MYNKRESCFKIVIQKRQDHIIQDINVSNAVLIRREICIVWCNITTQRETTVNQCHQLYQESDFCVQQ